MTENLEPWMEHQVGIRMNETGTCTDATHQHSLNYYRRRYIVGLYLQLEA